MSQFNNPALVNIPGGGRPTAVRRTSGTTAPLPPDNSVQRAITDTPPSLPVTNGRRLADNLMQVFALGVSTIDTQIEGEIIENRIQNQVDREQAALLAAEDAAALEARFANPLNPDREAITEALISGDLDAVRGLVPGSNNPSRFFQQEYREQFDQATRALRRSAMDEQVGRLQDSVVMGGRVRIAQTMGRALESGNIDDLVSTVQSVRDSAESVGVDPERAGREAAGFAMEIAAQQGRFDIAQEIAKNNPDFEDLLPAARATADRVSREQARLRIAAQINDAMTRADASGIAIGSLLESEALRTDAETGERVSVEDAERVAANIIIQELGDRPASMFRTLATNGLKAPGFGGQWDQLARETVGALDERIEAADLSNPPNDLRQTAADARMLATAVGTGYSNLLTDQQRDLGQAISNALRSEVGEGSEDGPGGPSDERVLRAYRSALHEIKWWEQNRGGRTAGLGQYQQSFTKQANRWIDNNRSAFQLLLDDTAPLIPFGVRGISEAEENFTNIPEMEAFLAGSFAEGMARFKGDAERAAERAFQELTHQGVGIERTWVDTSGLTWGERGNLTVAAKDWIKDNKRRIRAANNEKDVFFVVERTAPQGKSYRVRAIDEFGQELDGFNVNAKTVPESMSNDQKAAALRRASELEEAWLRARGEWESPLHRNQAEGLYYR